MSSSFRSIFSHNALLSSLKSFAAFVGKCGAPQKMRNFLGLLELIGTPSMGVN